MDFMAENKLSAPAINAAKPKDKNYRLYDGGGLYLEVTPAGGKLWRYKYRFAGKEKRLALGKYPGTTARSARSKRNEARLLVEQGVDPSFVKKQKKVEERKAKKNSFEQVAREWIQRKAGRWSEKNTLNTTKRFEREVFPWLGRIPIDEVTAPDLLAVLQRVERRGVLYTAHKIHEHCGAVFRFAIATARASSDPSAALKGALPPIKHKHHSSITDPKQIGALLRAINGYDGTYVAKCALKFAPLVFVRPNELRHAEWKEIDFDKSEWRIPGEKMKMDVTHLVPLSQQAMAILEDIHTVTGSGKYVFPSVRTDARPMSENTINAALRRLGYDKDQMTGHGFRSMASTLLNEQGWNPDAIERQLAHAERNAIRAAYNYSEYLPERRKMMQAWADYLEGLAKGADVVKEV